MSTHPSPAARSAAGPSRAITANLSARTPLGGHPDVGGAQPLTRRYDVSVLAPNGDVDQFSRVAPATPVFEDAFGAFARGTLVSTSVGPVAVEDLWPGAMVETLTSGAQPLLWVGSMTVYPERRQTVGGEGGGLIRLAADAFGLGRPAPDLVLGPRARILYRSSACRALVGTSEAFAPARAFIDGDGVIPLTPVSPVRVYHLGFYGQQILQANGMELESFHPGPDPEAMIPEANLALFLTLFPHIGRISDFGPIDVPRLTGFEVERLRAA